MKSKKEKESAPVVVKEQSRLEKLAEVAGDIFETKQFEKQIKIKLEGGKDENGNKVDGFRTKFFRLATEDLTDLLGPLDRIVVPLAEVSQYPEYREVSRTATEATLEQNVDAMGYEWVGDTFTVRRDIVHVGANFDAERFYREWVANVEYVEGRDDAALWDSAAQIVEKELVPRYTFNEAKAQELIDEHPELLPIFQKYTSPGKIQAKLMIGKPKTEEDE